MHFFYIYCQRFLATFKSFLSRDSTAGILLMIFTVIAMILANSSLAPIYFEILHYKVNIITFQHFINDILMGFFFLLVGLEIKREIIEGELSTWKKRILPGYAAIGGMIAPALIYLIFNKAEGGHPKGWAIPTTTDIAFTLGILSFIGSRIPASLKVFLTALTVLDDLGAVIIIAIFYTKSLNIFALGGALSLLILLFSLNRAGVTYLYLYGLISLLLWFFVFKSGIHTSIVGVAFSMAIPFERKSNTHSSFHFLEHHLKPWITFLIFPMFVFTNAGVSLSGFSFANLTDPVTLGVIVGLFIGKQVGIILASVIVIQMGWAELPTKSSWRLLYGIATLCGTGFTMSLFIALQAFPDSPLLQEKVKIGIISASIASTFFAYFLLKYSEKTKSLV